MAVAAIVAGFWVLSLSVVAAGYWVGKKNLSRWQAAWRVALISAIPILLVAGFVAFTSRVESSAEAPVASTAPDLKGDSSLPPGHGLADELQQAVDSLPLGQVIFHHPQQMQLRKQENVQVRISQDLQRDLASGLSAQGITEHDQIKVSASMKVRLTGDPYFDVKPLNDEEQLVTKNGDTEWSFTVLPLKRGNWPLHLVITAVIRTPWGTEKFKDYPVKDELVQVQVTAFNAIGFFVGDNWQWLATAVVIPGAIWVWKKRANSRKRRIAAARHAVMAVPLQKVPPPGTESSQPEPKETEKEEQKSA